MKPAKGDKGACDKLYSLIVRSREQCERCKMRGEVAAFQCAHIVRRTYSGTRTMTEPYLNAWCLCPACHWATEKDGYEFTMLVLATIGAPAYEELRRLAQQSVGQKFDWTTERQRLKLVHARIVSGEITTDAFRQAGTGSTELGW